MKQTPEHIAKRVASYKSKPRKLRDMRAKLLAKISKIETGCWVWTGAVFKKEFGGDYGQIRIGRRGQNKLMRAHRVFYEEFVGKIPEGMEIDHLCRNTLCVNPDHLEPVTHAVNMKRRIF